MVSFNDINKLEAQNGIMLKYIKGQCAECRESSMPEDWQCKKCETNKVLRKVKDLSY